MGNTPFFAIYEQGAICWETFGTLSEAQEFLGNGTSIEPLYPIAIYNRESRQVVWQNPDLSEDVLNKQLQKIKSEFSFG